MGLFQSLTVVPGVSRSGATILGGLLLGVNRATAVEFSFLLAVPTMVATTGLDALKTQWHFSSGEITMLIGILVSFLTAIAAVKFFMTYVSKHSFITFGIYRIVVATLFFNH